MFNSISFTFISKLLLSFFFISAGVSHFTNPKFFLKIMPSYLPLHLELVYISGIFEIIAGVMLLIPKTSSYGAILIIIILIGVFPANINMYLNHANFPEYNEMLLLLRLPLQFVLIYWAYTHIKL